MQLYLEKQMQLQLYRSHPLRKVTAADVLLESLDWCLHH